MNIFESRLLRMLPREEVEHFRISAIPCEFERGQTILGISSTSSHVYFIESGRVRESCCAQNGKEVVFSNIYEGEFFGLDSVAKSTRSRFDYIASTKCRIQKISGVKFRELIFRYDHILNNLLLGLLEVAERTSDRLYELRALSATQRTRAELLRFAKRKTNSDRDNFVVIPDMPTHEEIACSIFSHREAVTKEFSVLKKAGVLSTNESKHVIANIKLLEDLMMDSTP